MVTKIRWVETETVIENQSGIVAKFICNFCVKNLFLFPLATAKLLGDVWWNRQSGVKIFRIVITAPI